MKLEKIKNGCASLVRKAGKKTVIASMAVLVIGIAVLLNFLTLHDKTSVALNEELSAATTSAPRSRRRAARAPPRPTRITSRASRSTVRARGMRRCRCSRR